MPAYDVRVTYASLPQSARMLFYGVSHGDISRARATVAVVLGGVSFREAAAEYRIPKSSLERQAKEAKRLLAVAIKQRHITAADLVN